MSVDVRGWARFLQTKIFGWHRYRVEYMYKSRLGLKVFEIRVTMSVRTQSIIDQHRSLKKELGPLHRVKGIEKKTLCNGTLTVEPVCYLGRW